MTVKSILSHSLLLNLVSSSSSCPAYSCDSTVTDNVCAVHTSENNIRLNVNGCQGGNYCSAINRSTWGILTEVGSSTGTTYSCSADYKPEPTTPTPLNCDTKGKQKVQEWSNYHFV